MQKGDLVGRERALSGPCEQDGADRAARAVQGHGVERLRARDPVHGSARANDLGDAASVTSRSSLEHGSVALGTFNAPSAWRLYELVTAFLARHPGMTVRLVGRNSSWTAERVRRGDLEAAVVVLPIDDDKLEVHPLVRDEVLYVGADPARTRRPVTIERLAVAPLVFYDAESADADPIRQQLAERAQADGLRLRPRVEVEFMDLALQLVAAGVGDTYLPSAYTRAPYYPAGLATVGFSPALYDTFAVITRRAARLSPATRELIAALEVHMTAVADDLASGV